MQRAGAVIDGCLQQPQPFFTGVRQAVAVVHYCMAASAFICTVVGQKSQPFTTVLVQSFSLFEGSRCRCGCCRDVGLIAASYLPSRCSLYIRAVARHKEVGAQKYTHRVDSGYRTECQNQQSDASGRFALWGTRCGECHRVGSFVCLRTLKLPSYPQPRPSIIDVGASLLRGQRCTAVCIVQSAVVILCSACTNICDATQRTITCC